MARANGIRLGIMGADLILDAAKAPAPAVFDVLKQHKAEIMTLLTANPDGQTIEHWQALFEERAGIAELDGGQSRERAEAIAFECCVAEWLRRHPCGSDPDRCAACGKPDRDGHAVVPFGTADHGHTLLHPECWENWQRERRQQAQRDLASFGIPPIPF